MTFTKRMIESELATALGGLSATDQEKLFEIATRRGMTGTADLRVRQFQSDPMKKISTLAKQAEISPAAYKQSLTSAAVKLIQARGVLDKTKNGG